MKVRQGAPVRSTRTPAKATVPKANPDGPGASPQPCGILDVDTLCSSLAIEIKPMAPLPAVSRSHRVSGFTLVELLVVLAVIATLAGILVPTIARARSKAAEAGCRNNLRQLGIAMMLYLPDNLDVFPSVASRDAGGPMREDWVFWNVYHPGVESYFLNPRNSAIGPYLGQFDTNLFRCPSDQDVLDRERALLRNPTSGNPYLYSYALTSLADPSRNRGIGSIYARDQAPLHYYSHRIVNPANKLMLVEDNGDPRHAELLTGDPNRVIDDGRWVPTANTLSARHRYGRGQAASKEDLLNQGRGVVQFADGHVGTLSPARARLTVHCDPSK